MVILGVDAHTDYQAGLNVPALAKQGYGFLIAKATQGVTGFLAPPLFDRWIASARAAGLVPGAYHWLTSSDPNAQMHRFVGRLQAVGGPQGMLCALDVEDTANPPTWATVQGAVSAFHRLVPGHPLLLYTGGWWWKAAGRGWPGATLGCPLWASHYLTGSADYAKVPASWWQPGYGGWGSATILQFTDAGTAGGVKCDLNAFRGTVGELRALAGVAAPSTQEGEAMPFVARGPDGQYYVCDLLTSRPVPKERVADVLYLAKQLGYPHDTTGSAEWTDGGWTRLGWTEGAFGALPPTGGPVDMPTAAEVAAELLKQQGTVAIRLGGES